MEGHSVTSVCETQPKILNRSKLIWEIYDPSILLRGNSEIKSSRFGSEKNDGYIWQADARIVTDRQGKKHLGLCIDCLRGYASTIRHKYYIPPINDRKIYTKTFISVNGLGTDKFIAINDLNDYVSPSDKLTIVVEAIAYGDGSVTTIRPGIEGPEYKPRQDLGQLLFDSRESGDVTLVASKKEIRAHKAILMAESTVFSAMFKSQMIESKKNRVEINDVKPEVLEEMLRFIYTGKTTKLDEMMLDLCEAADKYDLRSLKVNCEAAMYKNISTENAMDVLIYADLHRSENLKKITVDFIVRHFYEVEATESYKKMAQSHQSLLGELKNRI